MRKILLISIALLLPVNANAGYDPFEDILREGASEAFAKKLCILKEVPGSKTNSKARSINIYCNNYWKSYLDSDYRSNWFAPKTSLDCINKYSDDSNSDMADKLIGIACRNLY